MIIKRGLFCLLLWMTFILFGCNVEEKQKFELIQSKVERVEIMSLDHYEIGLDSLAQVQKNIADFIQLYPSSKFRGDLDRIELSLNKKENYFIYGRIKEKSAKLKRISSEQYNLFIRKYDDLVKEISLLQHNKISDELQVGLQTIQTDASKLKESFEFNKMLEEHVNYRTVDIDTHEEYLERISEAKVSLAQFIETNRDSPFLYEAKLKKEQLDIKYDSIFSEKASYDKLISEHIKLGYSLTDIDKTVAAIKDFIDTYPTSIYKTKLEQKWKNILFVKFKYYVQRTIEDISDLNNQIDLIEELQGRLVGEYHTKKMQARIKELEGMREVVFKNEYEKKRGKWLKEFEDQARYYTKKQCTLYDNFQSWQSVREYGGFRKEESGNTINASQEFELIARLGLVFKVKRKYRVLVRGYINGDMESGVSYGFRTKNITYKSKDYK